MSEEPRQVVRSPEQVALHLPIAGPTSRMLAYFLDFLFLTILQIALVTLAVLVFPVLGRLIVARLRDSLGTLGQGPPGFEAFVFVLLMILVLRLLIEVGYFVVFEMAMGGRSPGKAAIRLRVLRDGGLPLDLRGSLVRNLLRPVDALPGTYVIGLVALVLSDEGKRLGDLAAGTIVVRLDRPEPAPLLPEGPAPADGFRFDRAQLAHLGQTELALVRGTLRRIIDLPPERAAPLLERAVEVTRARLGYGPVEPAEHEAFLRALLHAARAR